MDILVKSVLDYVQSQEGHTNSVLAGGAVRDTIIGLEPKDYDIVIPSGSAKEIHELAQSVVQEFGVEDMVCKTQDYTYSGKKKKKFSLKSQSENPQGLTCVYGFTFEGKRIDLIGHKEVDDEDFPQIVIDKFDFGLNMIYDTGSFVFEESPKFNEDLQWHQMSLINLDFMYNLPNAVARFERMSARYKEHTGNSLIFRAPCLELKVDKKKEEDPIFQKGKYESLVIDDWDEPVPVAAGATTAAPLGTWTAQSQAQVQAVLNAQEIFQAAPLNTPLGGWGNNNNIFGN